MGFATGLKQWTKEKLRYADLNGNFDKILAVLNGGIDGDNIDEVPASELTGKIHTDRYDTRSIPPGALQPISADEIQESVDMEGADFRSDKVDGWHANELGLIAAATITVDMVKDSSAVSILNLNFDAHVPPAGTYGSPDATYPKVFRYQKIMTPVDFSLDAFPVDGESNPAYTVILRSERKPMYFTSFDWRPGWMCATGRSATQFTLNIFGRAEQNIVITDTNEKRFFFDWTAGKRYQDAEIELFIARTVRGMTP
jgi:hypothetical protein